MKRNNILLGLCCFGVIIVSSLNVKNSLSLSADLSTANLFDIIKLNSASAEEGGGESDCKSPTKCEEVQGNKRGDTTIGNKIVCCRGEVTVSGSKKL